VATNTYGTKNLVWHWNEEKVYFAWLKTEGGSGYWKNDAEVWVGKVFVGPIKGTDQGGG